MMERAVASSMMQVQPDDDTASIMEPQRDDDNA
jgi:hypothetical protein